jgi:hypothetical protein
LREEHHAFIAAVAATQEEIVAYNRELRVADAEHERAVRHAALQRQKPPGRKAPSGDKVAKRREELMRQMWAAVIALAAFVEHVIERLRLAERRLLNGLAERRPAIERERREMETRARELLDEEYRLEAAAMWVMATADDIAERAGIGTAPEIDALKAPRDWPGASAQALTRRERRPWNR